MVAKRSRQSQGDREDVNQAFSVLAAHERRRIVEHFGNKNTETATITELVNEYQQSQNGTVTTEDQLIASFHHQHLPKLEDAGVVAYDRESQQVSYQGDALVENLLESAPDTNLRSSQ